MMTTNISTISDLRFKTKAVLAKTKKEPVLLFHRSTPIGALFSYEEYQKIMDTLEDYYIALKADEYEKENKKKVKWINHDKIKKRIAP